MVVQSSKIGRKILSPDAGKDVKQSFFDLAKSAALHSIWPVSHKVTHAIIISIAAFYTLLSGLMFLSVYSFLYGFKIWMLPLNFLTYIVFFYFGGYLYKAAFKIEKYTYYAYMCAMSVVYLPVSTFLMILLAQYAKGRISYVIRVVQLTVSCFIVHSNIKNVDYEERTAYLKHLKILVIQLCAILLIESSLCMLEIII